MFQLGWGVYHDRSLLEVAVTAVVELVLVAALVWLCVRHRGTLARKRRTPFGLSFLVCWLMLTAICVPVFTGADRDAGDMSAASLFATVVVALPLLLGLAAAVPISRGRRSAPTLVACNRCDTYASIRARYCMTCGDGLRDR